MIWLANARKLCLGLSYTIVAAIVCSAQAPRGASIYSTKTRVVVSAGSMQRRLTFVSEGVQTTSLTVDGQQLLNRPAEEVKFRIQHADPDERPKLLKPGEGGSIDATSVDALNGFSAEGSLSIGGGLRIRLYWCCPQDAFSAIQAA